jgi:hypothetical protein
MWRSVELCQATFKRRAHGFIIFGFFPIIMGDPSMIGKKSIQFSGMHITLFNKNCRTEN